ncbi:MAG: glycoside hydrolase family 30 beta sandwich domain-containing protein [Terracidiphilus sp.]|nr:glycoside hydrolase family 30 beta sandwich domain-containing protein [Terracidiphilus sp.]
MQSSRRSFLKGVSAAAVAVGPAGRALPLWAEAVRTAPVKVWSTYRDRRHAAEEALAWKPATQANADAILLNAHVARQQMLGFGAAMTDATCYVISQMKADERAALMHEMFAPGEMALNVCRTTIGASDYSRKLYSYDESDAPDPELKKFSIDYDKAYILPVLREARKVNPELFLFSSPWSPPGWMKANNSMLGGAMRKLNFGPYAQYFVKFLEGYKAAGVPIDAVTVQNETDAEQEGHMPACVWAQEAEIEFVKAHLGPALRKAGLPAKIWVLDHNYNLWGRAIDELSDPAAYEFIDGIAWHGYVGGASAMTRVHESFPDKNAYWTEGGPDIQQPDYATDYTTWATTFNGIVNNWSRSITAWNLALDEKGNPNIGPFPCGGTVTVENGTGKVTRSGQYWAFAHFSRHVKRGAQVFATEGVGRDGASGPVSHAGFRNPDGKHVVVLANKGPQTSVQLVDGGQMLEVDLPADSVFTLEWA